MSKRPGWIQSVQEMLREGLAVPDTELYEGTPGSTCRRVKIHRSGKSLIISFNATISFTSKGERVCVKDRLFPLFRKQEGVARMSDYWIPWETGDETPTLHVLLCELKSGKPDGVAQIENARLLADYVVKMVGHHRGLALDRVDYRGIIFCNHPLAFKAGLRPGKLPFSPRGRLQIPIAILSDRGEYYLPNLCA